MARKPRVEFPGALYHVISRGNRRQAIFHDREDRERYLNRLEHYRGRYGFTVYAYVLMRNHVHTLIETGLTPLSKIMQGLLFTYTRFYNAKYRKTGHLFQGRYKAILCDRDAYLKELVRYIHLNPGRMKKPVDPFRYRWSSHGAYVGKSVPVRVNTTLLLGQFAKTVSRARLAYARFMQEGLGAGHEQRYYATVDQRFLGAEEFVEAVRKTVPSEREDHGPSLRGVSFEALVREVAKVHGHSSESLVSASRQREYQRARSMLVYAAREWLRMGAEELGRRLSRQPSMISRLHAAYLDNRDKKREAVLRKQISK